MLTISVIDCAIKQASHGCFNQLVDTFEHKFRYHHPPAQGMNSLLKEDDAQAYIVFGSASNVGDNLGWHEELANFCLQKLNKQIPILGICFGHQLLGNKLGWPVQRNKDNRSFYGTRKIEIHQDAWGMKKGDRFHIFTAHSYCLKQVKGSDQKLSLIASTEECPVDIIAHHDLPFLGIQGHPEASSSFVENEIEENSEKLSLEETSRARKSGLEFINYFILNSEKLARSL